MLSRACKEQLEFARVYVQTFADTCDPLHEKKGKILMRWRYWLHATFGTPDYADRKPMSLG